MKYKLVFGLILLVPVLAFVVQNDQAVDIVLFKWQFSTPLPLLVLSAVLVGVVLGLLAAVSRKFRKSRLEKRAEKEQKKSAPAVVEKPQPDAEEPELDKVEPAIYEAEGSYPDGEPQFQGEDKPPVV